MKKNHYPFLAIVLVATLAAFLINSKDNSVDTSAPSVTPLPTSTAVIPQDWTYVKSEDLTIYYPKGFASIAGDGLSLVFLGPTQTEGTEMFDGINITVRTGTLDSKTLRQVVDDKVKQTKEDGVSEITQDLESTQVAGKQGFTFKARGLGEYTFIYLPKGTDNYLEVSRIVEDPGNLGFAETADQIISSMEF